MNLFIGILLVLGMMTLIFLGPEWVVGLSRELQGYKKVRPHL